MACIIKKPEEVIFKKFITTFFIKDLNRSFQFESNENGIIDSTRLKINDFFNYTLCINPKFKTEKKIYSTNKSYLTSALLKCDCNNEFYLSRPVVYCNVCGNGYYPNGMKYNFSSEEIKITYMKIIK